MVRRGGRVAYPNGVEPEPRPREGLKIISYDAVPGVREFERLCRPVEAAELEVAIAACYPLAEAAAAHERLARGACPRKGRASGARGQGAQKSTIAGMSLRVMWRSKVAALAATGFPENSFW
jgi:hypothetical protein